MNCIESYNLKDYNSEEEIFIEAKSVSQEISEMSQRGEFKKLKELKLK